MAICGGSRVYAVKTLLGNALRDSCRLRRRVFGLVNELAAHPLRFERIGASFNPGFLVADAVRAFFMFLFLCADHNNVGFDLPVGVDRCSAVTPLTADLDVLVKLKLWTGHLIPRFGLILAFCEVLRLRRKLL